MNWYFFVTLRLRAFAVKGFYRMPSLLLGNHYQCLYDGEAPRSLKRTSWTYGMGS